MIQLRPWVLRCEKAILRTNLILVSTLSVVLFTFFASRASARVARLAFSGPTLANAAQALVTYTNGTPTRTEHFAPAAAGGALLARTDYSTDSRGRLWQVSDLVGTVGQWKYDRVDNLRKVTDGKGNTTNIDYVFKAMADLPNSISWPGGQTRSGSYDILGRVTSWTNERGIQAQYGYDGADRVTAITFPACATHNLAFTYDAAGRPLTITAAGIGKSAQFVYNAQTKQLQSVTTTTPGPGGAPHTYTVSYVLSGDGKRKSMASSAGTVNYTWNTAGQITGLVDTLGQGTQWTYDHAGRPVTLSSTTRQGVPIVTSYSYGVSGQAGDPSTAPVYLRQITQTVNGSQVRQYTLKHSYLGQLLQRDGTWTNGRFETSTFTYDQRGRLTAETNKVVIDPAHQNPMDPLYPVSVYNANGSYTYDLSNNLNGSGGGSGFPPPMGPPPPPSGSWTYNSSNQLTSALPLGGLPGATGLGYDAAGNLTSANGMSLVWDPLGRLTSVTGAPGGNLSFTYDFLGRRVSKTVNGVTTYFLYDGDLLNCELDSNGNVVRSYDWGILGLVADRSTGTSRYYLFDPLGNTRAVLSGSGAILGRGAFTAWGSPIGTLNPGTAMAWQGAEGCVTDAESGLIYMLNRYYSPALGRFISRDPIGFDGDINLYGYASGDPINLSDPDGTDSKGTSIVSEEGRRRRFLVRFTREWDRGEHRGEVLQGLETILSFTPQVRGAKVGKAAVSEGPSLVARVWNWGKNLFRRNPAKAAGKPAEDAAKANAATGCAKGALRRVGDLLESAEDVIANPWLLKGKSPQAVATIIGSTPGWRAERLRHGSHEGLGWVFREYSPNGTLTNRLIRWHPGGGHHGHDPYWRV